MGGGKSPHPPEQGHPPHQRQPSGSAGESGLRDKARAQTRLLGSKGTTAEGESRAGQSLLVEEAAEALEVLGQSGEA